NQIMPAEKAFSLTDCIALLRQEDWTHQRRLSFEYIVFGGLNDTEAHARELVRLLGPIECRVNLIRFHDIPDSPFKGAPEEKMLWLRDYLTRHGVTTTIRASRGQDIFAACGLLSTAKVNDKI
ncbi:MAG: 23S rRNA (adenine(2503)-C(2))-methyltransferase RlmN, partial [Bacteroidaceae bacterium]|nr:23S rRNA (adenine(2503)-C(2))-methyltransferase RlmN [Bacteroidaceae bacterium]